MSVRRSYFGNTIDKLTSPSRNLSSRPLVISEGESKDGTPVEFTRMMSARGHCFELILSCKNWKGVGRAGLNNEHLHAKPRPPHPAPHYRSTDHLGIEVSREVQLPGLLGRIGEVVAGSPQRTTLDGKSSPRSGYPNYHE